MGLAGFDVSLCSSQYLSKAANECLYFVTVLSARAFIKYPAILSTRDRLVSRSTSTSSSCRFSVVFKPTPDKKS